MLEQPTRRVNYELDAAKILHNFVYLIYFSGLCAISLKEIKKGKLGKSAKSETTTLIKRQFETDDNQNTENSACVTDTGIQCNLLVTC